MAVEKIRKRKRQFERKRKRCKLCIEEMDVTEELIYIYVPTYRTFI